MTQQPVKHSTLTTSAQLRAADCLVSTSADTLRYIHGSPTGWHYWDGRRWCPDQGSAAMQRMIQVVREHLPTLVTLGSVAESTYREMQRMSAITGALALASNLDPFSTLPDEVNAEPFLLNLLNGTLDLRTLELRPHRPEDQLTQLANASLVVPDEDQLSMWSTFLETTLPDPEVRGYLQRLVGYSLTGQVTEHVFPVLIGPGGNGKGVFYQAVLHTLGDYANVFSPGVLLETKHSARSANAPAPALLELRDRRFVVTSETPANARLAVDQMKFFTGGDTITARALYSRSTEVFEPSHTMFLITNHAPELSADDAAAWQRITLIPFNEVIRGTDREIPGLTHKLRAATDAILHWAVEGLRSYYEQGLNPPRAVLARTAEYHMDVDLMAQFIQTELDTTLDQSLVRIPRTELWDAWQEYARNEGAPAGKRSDFYRRMESSLPHGKYNGVFVYRGVALESAPPTPEDTVLLELGES